MNLSFQFDSTESPELLNHVSLWAKELNQKFPDRDYKATVSDIDGRAVFIPRFLHALPLPPLVAADETSTGGTDNQIQCVNIIDKKEIRIDFFQIVLATFGSFCFINTICC